MGLPGFVFTFVFLLLNLALASRLKGRLTQLAEVELFLMVVGLLLWLVVLAGVHFHKRWAWVWNILLFSLSLGNVVWLYTILGGSLTFVLALGVNTFGLLASIIGLELYIPDEN